MQRFKLLCSCLSLFLSKKTSFNFCVKWQLYSHQRTRDKTVNAPKLYCVLVLHFVGFLWSFFCFIILAGLVSPSLNSLWICRCFLPAQEYFLPDVQLSYIFSDFFAVVNNFVRILTRILKIGVRSWLVGHFLTVYNLRKKGKVFREICGCNSDCCWSWTTKGGWNVSFVRIPTKSNNSMLFVSCRSNKVGISLFRVSGIPDWKRPRHTPSWDSTIERTRSSIAKCRKQVRVESHWCPGWVMSGLHDCAQDSGQGGPSWPGQSQKLLVCPVCQPQLFLNAFFSRSLGP